MPAIPLGLGAYRRQFAREPEIRLENRFVEAAPTNLKEHTALLGRPATGFLASFAPGVANGRMRGFYSKVGLFNGDLFVVAGQNLWRYDGTTKTHITGIVQGTNAPRVTWSKGIGYEYMFITGGEALYYYGGGTKAKGTLTSDGTQDHAAVVAIGDVYYTWTGSLTDPLADGTAAHPWIVKPGASVAEDLANLVNTITYIGVPGTDFSSTLGGPSTVVTATSDATTLTATYLTNSPDGNAVATTVTATHLSWGAATLAGGGVHALLQIAVPGGQSIESLASLAGYVLASVGATQKFYYIPPGDTTIDALHFAEKESSPDPIVDMAAVGDMVVLAGAASIEFWNATGDPDNAFAPIEGRTMARGIVPGSLVVVDEGTFIMVGNDWRVYSVGGSMQPISDHGIEERIRVQLRREVGLG